MKWNFNDKKAENRFKCKDAATLVIPYIKGELSDKELLGFTAHVRKCRECREELETYYIVYKGLLQLEEKEELPMNVIEALNEELEASETYLKNRSLFFVVSEAVKWLVNILCILLFVEKVMELIVGVIS